MSQPTQTIYLFSDFRLDPARRVLVRADGKPIPLKPKVFDTLLYLVERPFELIGKEALMHGIWPDAVVEENNLSQNISALRRVLGERPGEHRFIVTEPRRGYRFVAAVDQVPADADGDERSSAPLPTVTAAITDGLASGSGRRVAPEARWSSSAFRVLLGAFALAGVSLMLLVAGRAFIADGTRHGSQTPASVQAAEGAAATELPTRSASAYEYYLSGLEYQRRSDLEALPLAARQYQRSVEEDPEFALAWSRLSRVHLALYWSLIDHSDARLAVAHAAVERALDLQPDLPEAHLAMARIHQYSHHDPEAALREIEIAVRGMPNDPEPLLTRAVIERALGHWERALATSDSAIELDPTNPGLLFTQASISAYLRDYARAQELLDRNLDLQPDNARILSHSAMIPLYRDGDATKLRGLVDDELVDPLTRASAGWLSSLWTDDYESALDYLEAITSGQRLRGIGTFDVPLPAAYGRTYRLAGRQALAEDMFRTARALAEQGLARDPQNPRSRTELETELGEALAGLGETEAAVERARRALDSVARTREEMDRAVTRFEVIIRVLIPAGAFDFAIDELDVYLSAPGPWSIEGLQHHPEIVPIRDNPRFLGLVEKYGRR